MINCYTFKIYSLYVCYLVVYVLISILCVLCLYLVLCIVSPHIVVYFLFLYNFTYYCHWLGTQLQLIQNHIISYHIVSYHIISYINGVSMS